MENVTSVSERFLFRMGLGDVLRLSMFGTLISLTNDIAKLPLQIPGHTSFQWMGILLLGKGLIPRFGAGIIMGIVSGVLAVMLGLGKEGIFIFWKYFIPGLCLDFIAPFFHHKLDSPIVAAICGAIASLSKLATTIVLALALKIPMGFLVLGLWFTSGSHIVFGVAGGLLAAILIKRLRPRLTSWE